MVIYPIPVEVTQARIQLVVDQNAKAPPNTINQDLLARVRSLRTHDRHTHWYCFVRP